MRHEYDHGWRYESAQDLSHEVCVYHHELWNKDARAISVHVRHASVEVQVHCVNVVIGVVLGELLVVVHVIPLVVCDDAVIRRTLVLIAFHRSHFSVFEGKVFYNWYGSSAWQDVSCAPLKTDCYLCLCLCLCP